MQGFEIAIKDIAEEFELSTSKIEKRPSFGGIIKR